MNLQEDRIQPSQAEKEWAEITMQLRATCFDSRNRILGQMQLINIKPKVAFVDSQSINTDRNDKRKIEILLVEYAKIRIRLNTIHLLIDECEYNPNILFGKIRGEARKAVNRLPIWVLGMGFSQEDVDRLIDPDKLFVEEWNKIVKEIENNQTIDKTA